MRTLALAAAFVAANAAVAGDCEKSFDGRDRAVLLLAHGLGSALSFPAWTTVHEGSHALWMESLGGDVTGFQPYPQRDEEDGYFYFGRTEWRWANFERTPANLTLVNLAPKLTDTVMIGTYAALVATGSLPRSRAAQLALLILDQAATVDMAYDILSKSSKNDVVKTFDTLGLDSPGERLPARLGQASIALTGAAAAGIGAYRLYFAEPDGERRRGVRLQLTPGPGTLSLSGRF